MEKLDGAVLKIIANNILNKEVITDIIHEIKAKLAELTKKNQLVMLKHSKKQASLKLKITNLYNLVAEGGIQLDETLLEHLNALKSDLENTNTELYNVKRCSQLPIKKFGDNQIDAFVTATKKVLTVNKLEAAKQLLLNIVEKIEVCSDRIEIHGENFILVEYISKMKMGTSIEVPINVIKWQGWRDSNSQHSDLESDVLPLELHPCRRGE